MTRTLCGLMLLMAWLSWRLALSYTRRTEVLATADANRVLVCAAVFCVTIWSFAALAGMLGRYRYLAWAAVIAAALLAMDIAGIPLFDLPIIRLLGQGVQMATDLPETSAFVEALVVTVICMTGATALALVGSGAMASTLAQRMTARERAFALVALIAVGTISTTLEPKPVQPPFEITRGERYEGRWTRVGVLPAGTLDADSAGSLAHTIADDSDALIEALALTEHPPVFVLAQQGMDRHVMQRAALDASDGIVLKVAPNAPTENVRMLVAHSLVADSTLSRGMKDDRHVLLDGLATYWPMRDDEAGRERWWLRAASLPDTLPVDYLTNWAETSERFGECQSLALAFSVFDTLVQRSGRDPTLAAMKELFREPKDDLRVLFERRPAATLATAGVDFASVATAASAAREQARERHAQELARRPMIEASVDWRNTPGRGIEIETTVSGVSRYAAYYRVLWPWTTDAGDMPRFDVLGGSAVLPLSPSRSDRVLAVIEVDDEVLDCPVRVLAKRLEFR